MSRKDSNFVFLSGRNICYLWKITFKNENNPENYKNIFLNLRTLKRDNFTIATMFYQSAINNGI